jgi:hypothetical protein
LFAIQGTTQSGQRRHQTEHVVIDLDDCAKVNMTKSMLVLALSICFMISISGPCSGAKT